MEQEQLDSKRHTWKCSLNGTPCQPAGSSVSFRRLSRSLQSTQLGSVVTELQKALTDTRCTAQECALRAVAAATASQEPGQPGSWCPHTCSAQGNQLWCFLGEPYLEHSLLGNDLSTRGPHPQFACDMQDVLQVCLCMLLSCVLPCKQRRSDSVTELRQVALRRCWHVNHPRQPALSSFKQRRKGADRHGCKVKLTCTFHTLQSSCLCLFSFMHISRSVLTDASQNLSAYNLYP